RPFGRAQRNFYLHESGDSMLLQVQNDIRVREIAHLPSSAPVMADLDEERASDFSRFLIALDDRSRCSLFGYVVSNAMLLKHAEAATQDASKVIGIFVDDELRGVLEAYTRQNAHHAEVTLVVHQSPGTWNRARSVRSEMGPVATLGNASAEIFPQELA